MEETYDIIVIGAGAGGLNIAPFMNRIGLRTLLVERSDATIGGDCLNYGCVPSKALIHASRLVHAALESHRFGLAVEGAVDLKKVAEYVRERQGLIRQHENSKYLRDQGIDVVLGQARFVTPDAIEVNGNVYRGKKIVIATGSRPRRLDVPGMDRVRVHTNETIFNLEELPGRFLVIGGGPIGIELGQAFGRLGSKVTVVQDGPTFLPKEDPEIAEVLLTQLEQEGMTFHFNSRPLRFSSPNEVVTANKDGEETAIGFDAVLVSIGRELDIGSLDLEKAGIRTVRGKIVVDGYLRTTNRNVYVSGDAVGTYQFTHAAELHAAIIGNNLFSPIKKKVSYDHLSWVTYTSPEIATFGLNERQLRERGISFEKLTLEFADDDRAIVDDYREGKLILYVTKGWLGGGKILGGSMVAMNAGELFQELVLANSGGFAIKHLLDKIYPYPTASRVNKKIAADHMAKRLTPLVKRLLRWLYRGL